MGQFLMATSLKENISPGEISVAPATLVDECILKSKTRNLQRMKNRPLIELFVMQLRGEWMSTMKRGDVKVLG